MKAKPPAAVASQSIARPVDHENLGTTAARDGIVSLGELKTPRCVLPEDREEAFEVFVRDLGKARELFKREPEPLGRR